MFQPKDWDRIQKSLAKYNEAAEKAEAQKKDRENLHMQSKELVKHWENTIEVRIQYNEKYNYLFEFI